MTDIRVTKLLAICLLGTLLACGGTTVQEGPTGSGPPETVTETSSEYADMPVETSGTQMGAETTEKPLTLDDFPDAIIDAFFNYEPTEKVLSLKEMRWPQNEDEMASMAKTIGLTVEQIIDYTSADSDYHERPLSSAVGEAFGRRESCAGQPLEERDSCSPDGFKILTSTQSEAGDCARDLQIVRSDGSTERLTDNEFYMDDPVGWSQDGQEIFFTRVSDWSYTCARWREQLWAIGSDGANERRLGTFSDVSFNFWRRPPDAKSDDEREYVWVDNPEGEGFSYMRTYGPRVYVGWAGGYSFLSSPMTVDQGTNLPKSTRDYWERGAIREAVDVAAAVAEEISTLNVNRFSVETAFNGIGVDGFYLSGDDGPTRAFVFIGGGGKQGISVPTAIYMPVLDCGGIGGVPQALLKWVLGALQDFEKTEEWHSQSSRFGWMSEWPYWNGSYSLDDQWGTAAAHVLAPLDWEPEFEDGCGSGSTTTWRKHSNPESNDRIRVHTGVSRSDWFETDGVKDSINPLYLPEGATVTRLSRTVLVYEIQNGMNVVGVWRVLGDDSAYTEATLYLEHRDTSFMNAFVTHQLQVVAGTDLNYRVAE